MKRLLVVVLMGFLPLAMAAQTTRVFVKQAGEFANYSANPDQFNSISLSVSRLANSGTPATASISYTQITLASDFNSETFVQIFGTIPASSFTGATTKDLVLNLDTSTLDPTTSFSQSCTLDFSTFNEVCGPAPAGVINIEFQENGIQRTRVIDFNEIITNGSTTTHIRQKSDNSTANVSGSIFGAPINNTAPNTVATVGVNHDSSLEVIK
jgi:hypothetical protein